MDIGGIDTQEVVFVVAEIGNNHEGDVGRARELVHRAAECGVQAVKFQTFRTEWFTSPVDPARIARLRSFELTFDDFAALATLARSLGLKFISTPLDLESAKFLATICDALKVASGDNDYWDLVQSCAKTPLPLIVSSGMSTLGGLRQLVHRVRELRDVTSLAILHCTSSYPVPPEQANLRVIPVLASELGCTIGYSDHTLGIEACAAAVALGARIIEKHFTLSKTLSDFRDHQLSADPKELTSLVARIHEVERLLGSASKEVQACEREVMKMARRSAAAARDLQRGSVLERSDIVFLRPATGVSPGDEHTLVGRRLKHDVSFGTLLSAGDLD